MHRSYRLMVLVFHISLNNKISLIKVRNGTNAKDGTRNKELELTEAEGGLRPLLP